MAIKLLEIKAGDTMRRRSTTIDRVVEDYAPATPGVLQKWKVNGEWYNYSELLARYAPQNVRGKNAASLKAVKESRAAATGTQVVPKSSKGKVGRPSKKILSSPL